jgi:hypothetical protein
MIAQLQARKVQLEVTIQTLLGEVPKTKTAAAGTPKKRKSHMSAAARKRISMVQKARWAKIKAARK